MMAASASKLPEQNVRVIVMAFPHTALSHYNRGLQGKLGQANVASNMPKKSIQNKLIQFKVYRLKGSPAAFIGIMHAPDEKAALKAAIKEFEITPEQQNRLLIRRS